MKARTILIALIAITAIRCKNKSTNSDLTGTFISNNKSEYSIASDTLVISAVNQSGKNYQIERKTGFQKIRDGVVQEKEFKNEKWQSTWDEYKQVLSETDYGRQITLGKNGQVLTLKNTQYQRIK